MHSPRHMFYDVVKARQTNGWLTEPHRVRFRQQESMKYRPTFP